MGSRVIPAKSMHAPRSFRSLFFYHCIQMYHINVDRLLIHDKGYGEPWAPDVPFMPSSGTATPRSVRVLSGMAMLIPCSTLSMPSRPPKKLGSESTFQAISIKFAQPRSLLPPSLFTYFTYCLCMLNRLLMFQKNNGSGLCRSSALPALYNFIDHRSLTCGPYPTTMMSTNSVPIQKSRSYTVALDLLTQFILKL